MEMEFEKRVIGYQNRLLRDCQSQELTQDLKLPEGMPDVGTVLGCWGQCVLRTKEWRSESIGVSGGVIAWVLYLPEGGGLPQCMETWLPYQMKWNIPKTPHDGSICAAPCLYSADARSLSSRKLMLRINLGVLVEAWCGDEVQISTPGEIPEDVQVLKHTYPMRILKEVGERPFDLEETLEMSTAEPKPERILRSSLQPQILESKLMGDKAVFRGVGIVHILYSAEDGQIYSRDFDVPFSQYSELEGEYTADGDASVSVAVTGLEVDLDPEKGIEVKVGLLCQYKVFEDIQLEMVEDAYSNRRTVELQIQQFKLQNILDSSYSLVHASGEIGADVRRCVDISFMVRQPQLSQGEDLVDVDMSGTFRILYYDPEGELACTSAEWNDTLSVPTDSESRVEMMLVPMGRVQANSGDGSAHGDVSMETVVIGGTPIQIVAGMNLGQLAEPDPKRPSLILRRTEDRSLWDIAKITGSTVDLIRSANSLEGEPSGSQILLIPVP